MKIGWSTWEPGLTGSTKVSAGGAAWTSYLFNFFRMRGHEIIWLQPSLEAPAGTQKGSIEECDVAFICWRWAMPERPERQAAYEHQMAMLKTAEEQNIRLIIHDEDYKMTAWEIDWLARRKRVILTRPELFPHKPFRSLIFPNPYMYETVRLPFTGSTDLVYIGNNYERYGQAQLFLAPFSEMFQVDVYGNWMEHGPDRQSPETVAKDFPLVHFRGRLPQEDTIKTLAQADSTIHLFKREYGRTGFITIRWAEAAAAGIPAFIPATMRLNGPFQEHMRKTGFLVKDGREAAENFAKMDGHQWIDAAIAQRLFVNHYMNPEPWIEMAEELYAKR